MLDTWLLGWDDARHASSSGNILTDDGKDTSTGGRYIDPALLTIHVPCESESLTPISSPGANALAPMNFIYPDFIALSPTCNHSITSPKPTSELQSYTSRNPTPLADVTSASFAFAQPEFPSPHRLPAPPESIPLRSLNNSRAEPSLLRPLKGHSCELCPESFSCRRRLKQHKVAAHGRSHGCSECKKPFNRQGDLDRHIKEMHPVDGEKKFECRCVYTSTRRDNYRRHLKKCSDEGLKPVYRCFCGHHNESKERQLLHLSETCRTLKKKGRKKKTMINSMSGQINQSNDVRDPL